MAADLLDERHDCGADTLQGAEYTSDGTPCVLQMKAKCAGDAVGGNRVSEKISTFLRDTRADPSTTIKRPSWTPLADIIRGNAALDALDSKPLRVQQNHAYRRIAEKCAGCATPPISDTSISPQVLGDDTGLYTPFEPSDSTPTQKIEQIYQIPHSPSEPTTSNDRLPTKAPKTTNAPEHGTVNATEPSKATAFKGAPGDPTKSGSICQSINFLPSETIFIASQQDTKSSIPTSTKERPTQPLDAHGFPDICASTSTAGQTVGNDGAGSYSGGLCTPCATPIVLPATDNNVSYDCLLTGQGILDEDPTVRYPTKFGDTGAAEISVKSGFLDGGALRPAPALQTRSLAGSPTPSDTTTLFEEPCNPIGLEKAISSHKSQISPASSIAPPFTFGTRQLGAPVGIDCSDIIHKAAVGAASEETCIINSLPSSPPSPLGHRIPPELFQKILLHLYDLSSWVNVPIGDKARSLGQIALTCRYWACQVRSIILADLSVKSRLDVERMDAVLKPPADFSLPRPHIHMRKLEMAHDDTDLLWIYDALKVISQHPELGINLVVNLVLSHYAPPARHETTPMSSVLFFIPRPIPNLTRQIGGLQLYSTTFKHASDFFRLVGEFPSLQWLDVGSVVWEEGSSQSNPPTFPSSLARIYIHEADRYSSGGRGLLPWILSAVAYFPHGKRQRHRPRDSQNLPIPLLPHTSQNIILPPPCPFQAAQIADLLYVFYEPGVSSILESEKELEWSITRAPGYRGQHSAYISVFGLQKFDDGHGKAIVTPSIDFVLETRPSGGFPAENLFVTQICVDFIPLKPTTQELLQYDWGAFFGSLSNLRHLENVKFNIDSAGRHSDLLEEHRLLIDKVRSEIASFGGQLCHYQYLAEDAPVLLV